MYALNDVQYTIYFGGSYAEHWSENYALSIEYKNRRAVTARLENGRWRAAGGDEELAALLESADCPALTRQYFDAAATAYHAAQDCLHRGLTLDRLRECFYADANPLVAPELMRLLMDDCGFAMNVAYNVTAHCCADIRADGVSTDEMYSLQPRTAHIISLLRSAAMCRLAVLFDSRLDTCRRPGGALRCGETVRLAFRVLGGSVRTAALTVYGDAGRAEYPMAREGRDYAAYFTAPDAPQALWFFFRIETDDGTHWLCPDATGFIGRISGRECGGFRLTAAAADFDTPAWFRRGIMYQIFPDRFAFSDDGTAERGVEYHKALGQTAELHASIDEPVRWQPRVFERDYSPDDFYGGTLRGIEQKLGYLEELGISVIYLNPIVEARSNHRYDASDYMRPDPILGTEEDFERLCAAAAERGIRIILDGVFSHTGADSIYFNRYGNYPSVGACQGEQSEFYNWYDFKHFPDEYRCWWGFRDLPEVNELNEDWENYVILGHDSVVKTWLRRGASGWRLDVADELPDETLSLIRASAKAEKPDALILGEVWEDAVIKESYGKRRNYALGCSLDSVMNYPFRNAVLAFARGHMDAYALRDFLIAQQMNYPKPMYYSLMNLLGTHDVDRLRTALCVDFNIRDLSREEQLKLWFSDAALRRAVELERLCALIQFAVPGVPSVYYGDEQGMCGVCDPFNRQPFREGERELHDYYAYLARERRAADAMSTGEAVFMAENADMLMILRYIVGGKDAFGADARNGAYLAVINRGDTVCDFAADCSAAGCGVYTGTVAAHSGQLFAVK